MIFAVDQNCFYDSICKFESNDYQLYKEGSLIHKQKIKQMMNKNQITVPIIAKLKVKNKHENQIANQNYKQILDQLSVEDKQVFDKNKGIIFEEWRKFKFLNAAQLKSQQLTQQQITKLMEKFISDDEQIKKSTTNQLQYCTKNWRRFLKHSSHSLQL